VEFDKNSHHSLKQLHLKPSIKHQRAPPALQLCGKSRITASRVQIKFPTERLRQQWRALGN